MSLPHEGMLIREPAVNPMKALKLLVAIALPLSALTPIFLSTPAFSDQRIAQTYGQVCWRGDRGYLWAQDAGSPINIRDGASIQAYARHIGYRGDQVKVLQRTPSGDGYCWYQVKFAQSGATGWVRGDFIVDQSEDY